jgi:hypothetical protein
MKICSSTKKYEPWAFVLILEYRQNSGHIKVIFLTRAMTYVTMLLSLVDCTIAKKKSDYTYI